MDKQEKIVCAAVKVARVKNDYKGVKIVTGIDYQSIYNDGVLSYLANEQDNNIWQNGFITSKNRFVDTKEAMKIAIKAGQYPDYQNEINKLEQMISNAKEAEARNKSHKPFEIINSFINLRDEFVLNYERLQAEVNALKAIAERAELKPEDLY